MKPLCPELFRRLEECFGSVGIANEGDIALTRTGTNFFTGEPREEFVCGGEEYRVSCPRCGDGRQRLYIHHLFGQFRFLVKCHNEDCYDTQPRRDQLWFMLFGTRRPAKVKRGVGRGDPTPAPPVIRPAGEVLPFEALPPDHPARLYLSGRGFDLDELARLYGVGVCVSPAPGMGFALGRIIIPIHNEFGSTVGWTGRFAGDRVWKNAIVPKFYAMPGLVKSKTLYNVHRAKAFPYIVVVEGPSDVWRVGPHAVALIGKSYSTYQYNVLMRVAACKPLVVMLDGDARGEGAKLTQELAAGRKHSSGSENMVRVDLEDGVDPADLDSDVLDKIIRNEAARSGVSLPSAEVP